MYDDAIPPAFSAALYRVAAEMLQQTRTSDAGRFARYVDDPIGFFREELGVTAWESESDDRHGQADIVRDVGAHDRVAVKSGHKVSKSMTASGLALWWVATRKGARAVITAPTFNQIKGIIWRELRARFRDRGLAEKLGAELPLDPSTGLQLPNGNEILGISTKTAENLAGISAPNLLFIVDEASGFPDDLWEVILGNSAGGAKIFAISNPTRTTGWFFKLFKTRAKGWQIRTISSETTPNVRAGQRIIPGLATREWIDEMREACGPDWENDPTYLVRVRGQFPPQGADSVVSLRLVEEAVARWLKRRDPPVVSDGELVLGVDVARHGGDASVIQPVRGKIAYEPRAISGADGNVVAAEVVACAREMRLGLERIKVCVDGIGVGASVVDALKVCPEVRAGWIYLVDLNVGEVADDENHVNLRSQVWFGVAQWLKEGGTLPDHELLQTELLSATYEFDARGRKKVLEKKKMRAILGRSPDNADALCLATYRGPRGARVEYTYDSAKMATRTLPDSARSRFYSGAVDDAGGGGRRGGKYGGMG